MSPKELIKDEICVELYPHHTIDFSLVDVLDQHQEVVSQYDSAIAELNAHRVSLKDSTIIVGLQYYLLLWPDLDAHLQLLVCTYDLALYFESRSVVDNDLEQL